MDLSIGIDRDAIHVLASNLDVAAVDVASIPARLRANAAAWSRLLDADDDAEDNDGDAAAKGEEDFFLAAAGSAMLTCPLYITSSFITAVYCEDVSGGRLLCRKILRELESFNYLYLRSPHQLTCHLIGRCNAHNGNR